MHYFSPLKEEIDALHKCLSFRMEGAEFSEAYRDGHWDGYNKFYEKSKSCFWQGLMNLVEKALSKRQIKYKKEGFELNPIDWIKFSSKISADNRDYQRESIKIFIKIGSGIILVPTRGGKTYIASETIRLLIGSNRVVNAFFLVDNVDLFNQAINDIANYLGVSNKEIGRIRESKMDIKSVTVGMVQTVQNILYGKKSNLSKESRLRKSKLDKYIKSVEFTIIDEIQEYGTSSNRVSILRKFTAAKYYLGLSATPHKGNNKMANLNVDSVTGGIIYDIHEDELVKRKVLADNKMLLLLFENDLSRLSDEITYSEVVEWGIIKNVKRNALIAFILSSCDKLGLKTIAMFNSKEHGKSMKAITGYDFISSDSTSEKREKAKEELLSKSGGVLLVSDIWKKGITLPSVEVLLNISGGKEPSLFIQRRGRILGVTENKTKALYIDFIDNCPHYIGDHSLGRIEEYEKRLDKKNIDVLDTDSSEIHKDIREYLIEFFELNIQE